MVPTRRAFGFALSVPDHLRGRVDLLAGGAIRTSEERGADRSGIGTQLSSHDVRSVTGATCVTELPRQMGCGRIDDLGARPLEDAPAEHNPIRVDGQA